MGCASASHHSASPQAWYSFAVRKTTLTPCRGGTLMVFFGKFEQTRDGVERLFLCTFAEFYISRKEEKASRVQCEVRLWEERLPDSWHGRLRFYNYLISKNTLILSEIWRNDC
jgi:hypothetical protein